MTNIMQKALKLMETYSAHPERVSKARLAEMLEQVVAVRGGNRRLVCDNVKCEHHCLYGRVARAWRQSWCLRYPTQKTMIKCLDKIVKEVNLNVRKKEPS